MREMGFSPEYGELRGRLVETLRTERSMEAPAVQELLSGYMADWEAKERSASGDGQVETRIRNYMDLGEVAREAGGYLSALDFYASALEQCERHIHVMEDRMRDFPEGKGALPDAKGTEDALVMFEVLDQEIRSAIAELEAGLDPVPEEPE